MKGHFKKSKESYRKSEQCEKDGDLVRGRKIWEGWVPGRSLEDSCERL